MYKRTAYDILGVPEGSDADTCKKAYRSLARKYHPDQYLDPAAKALAEEKMVEINTAYDSLEKRNFAPPRPETPPRWSGQPNPQGPYYGGPTQTRGGSDCCESLACLCLADSLCECMGGDLVPCL